MRIFKLTGLALLAATTANAEFQDYHADIPGTGQGIAMVAIKGGSFVMGSTAQESGREFSEGPQRLVTVADFWMGRYEISWQQYDLFVDKGDTFDDFRMEDLRVLAAPFAVARLDGGGRRVVVET